MQDITLTAVSRQQGDSQNFLLSQYKSRTSTFKYVKHGSFFYIHLQTQQNKFMSHQQQRGYANATYKQFLHCGMCCNFPTFVPVSNVMYKAGMHCEHNRPAICLRGFHKMLFISFHLDPCNWHFCMWQNKKQCDSSFRLPSGAVSLHLLVNHFSTMSGRICLLWKCCFSLQVEEDKCSSVLDKSHTHRG